LRAGFISIEGGEYDGWTVADILDSAPPELAGEIYAAITEHSLLTANESKNSPSPGISGTPEAGQTSGSTVPIASGGNSGVNETASSSTPSA
jgi:hypothetical protein